MKNHITKLLGRIAKWFRDHPFLSTVFVASILSFVWLLMWFFVFFITTIVLELNTPAFDFIVVLWFSVAVEAVIRLCENTSWVAFLSKPHETNPQPDNVDYRFGRALAVFSFILLCASIYLWCTNMFPNLSANQISHIFVQLEYGHSRNLTKMLLSWWDVFREPTVNFPIFLAFFLRVVIYKRNHKPS